MGDSNHDYSDCVGRGQLQPLTRYIAVLNPRHSDHFCRRLLRHGAYKGRNLCPPTAPCKTTEPASTVGQFLPKGTQSQSPFTRWTLANLQDLSIQVELYILAEKHNFDSNWLNQKCPVLLKTLNKICDGIWVQYRLQCCIAEQVDWIILQQYALVAGDTS